MQLPLDRDSPVPLYHQIAEALRWQISTGRLAAGERLPAVREAAEALGVNMHTVRRAYTALAEDGLVESSGGRGTWVLGRRDAGVAETPPADAMESFITAVAGQARERFGLTPAELARWLAALPVEPADGEPPVVHVLECSESQCRDHCEELAAVWDVDARPWSLERPGEPPAGPLIATYFHYAEILRRWPRRRDDLRFLPIHVDPALPHRLASAERLEACEMDDDRARNLQADLEALFPPGAVPVSARLVSDADECLAAAADDTLLCFAPRAWARLRGEQRRHPRVRKVRYVIDAGALDGLGEQLGWSRATAG